MPSADPERKRNRITLKGELPSPLAVPAGCPFAPRCWKVQGRCPLERPELSGYQHASACFFPESWQSTS
ncbi:MAG: hypothetical protein KL801_11455 [Mesorhizobium sp.]|nr:hypothetical protein [Mesorhizobium sp.]